MFNAKLIPLVSLAGALWLSAGQAARPITLDQLTDDNIRACLNYPDRREIPWETTFANVRITFDPARCSEVRGSHLLEPESDDPCHDSWAVAVPVDSVKGYRAPTVVFMTNAHAIPIPVISGYEDLTEDNICLFGRAPDGAIRFINRYLESESDHAYGMRDSTADFNPNWLKWFRNTNPAQLDLLVTETDDHGGTAYLYGLDLASGRIVRSARHFLDEYDRLEQSYSANSVPGYAPSGVFYLRRKIHHLGSERARGTESEYYIVKDGRFILSTSEALGVVEPLRFNAVASPYLLPVGLLNRLIPKRDPNDRSASAKRWINPAIEPSKKNTAWNESSGCELGVLGLKEIDIYISSAGEMTGWRPSLAARAAVNPITVLNLNSHGKKVFETAEYAAATTLAYQGKTVEECEQKISLPQVNPARPAICESTGIGWSMSGEVVRVSVPACPFLKMSARARGQNGFEAGDVLLVPVEGEIPSADKKKPIPFVAMAYIRLIPGDWDERFSGTASTPANK